MLRRLYLNKLEMYVDRNVVKIITGVRRSGKTTLIRQFIEELKESNIPDERIFYVNFEGVLYSYFNKSSDLRDMMLSFVESVNGEHCYIFLDELQCVEDWDEVIAEMLNLCDCDIYVSSSNASLLRGDFAKKLDYRYVKIDVYPLTFSEYLEMTAGEPGHYAEEGSEQLSRKELFDDYLRRGFMPGAYTGCTADNEEFIKDYLRNVYNTILLKDVVQCNKLRDISHLDKIMEYILSHTGETFSPKSLRDHVKAQGVTISVDTVYSFLDALTGSYLIRKVPRYDIKADRELETHEKYYICDTAMRNAVMGDEGASYESMIETALCLELLARGFKLYVGKNNQSQIDFMGVKGDDRTYLNCCATVDDKDVAKKKFGSLVRIRDNYFKMVLSTDSETRINKGGIINYPITEFMAQG